MGVSASKKVYIATETYIPSLMRDINDTNQTVSDSEVQATDLLTFSKNDELVTSRRRPRRSSILRIGEGGTIIHSSSQEVFHYVKNTRTGKKGFVSSHNVAEKGSPECHDWYFGSIGFGRERAEILLAQEFNIDGSYLIRKSDSKKNSYALSVKVFDIRINRFIFKHLVIHQEDGLFFITRKQKFDSLASFAEACRTGSLVRHCPRLNQICRKQPRLTVSHNLAKEKEASGVFSLLPDEIVLRILSFLDSPDLVLRAELVCRRFGRLCSDPSLWRRLDIPSSEVFDHIGSAVRILERCTRLEEVSVGSDKAYNNFIVLNALRQCPVTLTKIRVKLLGDSAREKVELDEFLETLGRFDNSVRSLEMSGYIPDWNMIQYSWFRKLTTLRIEGEIRKSNDLFEAIGGNCKSLKVCFLPRCVEVKDDGLNAFIHGGKETLEELCIDVSDCTGRSVRNISKCTRLRVLKIVHWTKPSQTTAAAGAAADVLSSIVSLPRLQSLAIMDRLSPAIRPDDIVLSFIGKRLGLQHLQLIHTAMEDLGLGAIADSCGDRLRSLDIFSTNCKISCAVGIAKVLSTCGNLTALRLGTLTDWSPSAFKKALRGSRAQLVRLGLAGKYRRTISGDDMMEIGRLMPNMAIVSDAFF